MARALIKRSFLAVRAEDLAPALLGCVLVRALDDGTRLSGRIVETEAYVGPEDRASHAFNGHRSARNEHMYARPGTSYVYFTYGMHYCMNIAAFKKDHPAAVLIRALEPLDGIEPMRAHRRRPNAKRALSDRDLCSGPAKLCQALRIDKDLSGFDLCVRETLWLERGDAPASIETGPRIGIDRAQEWVAKPLRFWEAENPNVSR
ncbi:MAG: DNA-3-methyladenine glycosylase [Planctomycetota bacterium]